MGTRYFQDFKTVCYKKGWRVVSSTAKKLLMRGGGAAVSARTFDQEMKLLKKQGKAILASAKPTGRSK